MPTEVTVLQFHAARVAHCVAIAAVSTMLATVCFCPPDARAATDATRTPGDPSYDISLAGDAHGHRWTGTESITFQNVATITLDTVWLRLWSNGISGCARQAITVSAVAGGTAGKLTVNCTALPVALDTPLSPGATATISMHVAISVPARNDRFGYSGGLTMIGTALPTLAIHDGSGWHLDPFIDLGESFYSVIGSYHVTLAVPNALSTPTTGVLVSSSDNGNGTQTRVYAANNVRDFEWAAGALDEVNGTDAGNDSVRVWYRPSEYSRAAAKRALATAIRSMNEFSRDFGPYPYGEVDVVLSPLPYGGMEYPQIVFTRSGQLDIAHELAHQWWYGIVGNDQFSSPWLDESFASWSEALPWTPYHCDGPYAWPSRAARLTNSMAYWGSHPKQYWIPYDQGTCALAAIADRLGLQPFIGVLRDYARDHWLGISTTADFKAAIAKAAANLAPGWDVDAFWQEWRIGAT